MPIKTFKCPECGQESQELVKLDVEEIPCDCGSCKKLIFKGTKNAPIWKCLGETPRNK